MASGCTPKTQNYIRKVSRYSSKMSRFTNTKRRMQSFTGLHPSTTRPILTPNANLSGRGPSILLRKTVRSLKSPTGAFIAPLRKREQRSFCSAQNPASFGVKLAYGVIFAGNSSKEKARNFSVHQEVSGFVILKLEIYWSIGFIVGTGQGSLTNGFIFLYKPIHAASFFPLPYVTLRNPPQLIGNLV